MYRKIITDLATNYLLQVKASVIKIGDGYDLIFYSSEMVDTKPLGDLGVPLMRNEVEDTPTSDYYFTYHHSAGDTMSVMNADDMDDNVVAVASIFFLVADLDETLPRN